MSLPKFVSKPFYIVLLYLYQYKYSMTVYYQFVTYEMFFNFEAIFLKVPDFNDFDSHFFVGIVKVN